MRSSAASYARDQMQSMIACAEIARNQGATVGPDSSFHLALKLKNAGIWRLRCVVVRCLLSQ